MYPRKNNKPLVPNPSARRRRRQRCSQEPEDYSKRFTSHYVDLHSIVPKSPPPSFYEDDDIPQPSTSLYATRASKEVDSPPVRRFHMKLRSDVSPPEKNATALCSDIIPTKNKKSARFSKHNKVKQTDEKEDFYQSGKLSEATNRKADDYKIRDGKGDKGRPGEKTPETSKFTITYETRKLSPNYPATRSACLARAYAELEAQPDPKPYFLRERHGRGSNNGSLLKTVDRAYAELQAQPDPKPYFLRERHGTGSNNGSLLKTVDRAYAELQAQPDPKPYFLRERHGMGSNNGSLLKTFDRAYAELKAQSDPKPYFLRERHGTGSNNGSLLKTVDSPIPYDISDYNKKKNLTAKEPAKKATKEPVKKPVKKPANKPTKEPAKEPTKEPAKEPAKEPVKEPAKEPVKEPAKQPAKECAKKPANNSVDPRLPYDFYRPRYGQGGRGVEEFADPHDFWARVHFPNLVHIYGYGSSSRSERHGDTTGESSGDLESYDSDESLYEY